MRQNLIFIFLILIVSCEKPSDCTEYYFSQDYKSHLFFNNGSYWIYEDTLNNIIDTITLISHQLSFDDRCTPSNQPHETLEQEFTSTYFTGDNNNKWSANGNSEFESYMGGLLLGWYADNDGVRIDSMKINDIWYKDILEIDYNGSKYFWAIEIGLIKKIFDYNIHKDNLYHFEIKEYHLE